MTFLRALPFFLIILLALIIPRNAYAAVAFDLVPPSGPLTRGQDVQFIIDIDTQGSSVTSAAIGLQYDTQYLQYKSATQGDAMSSLTVTQSDASTLSLSGTNPSGFNGAGTFAYVTFTLIATAPGSTELCTLVPVAQSPTPIPSSGPQPTQLPQTGETVMGTRAAAAGGVLLMSAIGFYIWHNRNKYESKPSKHKKHA